MSTPVAVSSPNPALVIVGGGAAGMCAAISARIVARTIFRNSARKASQTKRVSDDAFRIILLERNARCGIKIRISGGGKCNITHAGAMSAVLTEGFFRLPEQRFLKPCFYDLTNETVLSWLHQHGVETFARENGRVFPTSGKADDVLIAFEQLLDEHRIEVITNARVSAVSQTDSGFEVSVETRGQILTLYSPALILATGGVSYQKTGTTGDGIRFAKALGHTAAPLRAALAPIYFTVKPVPGLVGVSLRGVGLIAKSDTDRIVRTDDVLITHLGISGPACLSISRDVAERLVSAPVEMQIDFFTQSSSEDLTELFVRKQSQTPTQFVRTFFETLLPDAVVPFLFAAATVSPERKWHALTKDERKRLVWTAKAFPLGAVKEVPMDKGEVSAGGVALPEVNSKTMESRRIKNLYFAGEMLDVAGEVGGFNLQAAYSTGWVAGRGAATALLRKEA